MPEREQSGSDSAGARLAGARTRLGLSVEQVADKLRLDANTVVALESGDHQVIGAPVFVRGFLRRYAELVGESRAEIDALYGQRPDAALAPDLTSTGIHRLQPEGHRRRLGVVPATIAAAVLGVVAAIWWAVRAPPVVPSDRSERVEVLHVDAGTANPGLTPRALESTPTAPLPLASAAAEPAPAPAAAAALAPRPEAPQRHLQVTFNGESWTEVYDARGWRLFFGFGHAGSSQTLVGVPPFRLVLGNVDAVAVAVEGAPVALPAATPGSRLRVSLNGRGAVAGVR